MKKQFGVVLLCGALLLGGAGAVMAADETPAADVVCRFAGTVQERLEARLQRIDDLVKAGEITEERATEIRTIMEERAASCTEPGANRESNERLGIGFGRMSGGRGCGGPGLGAGNGFGRNR